MPPTKIFFTVRWAPGRCESCGETATAWVGEALATPPNRPGAPQAGGPRAAGEGPAPAPYLSGHGPLWFNDSAVHFVRPGVHGGVNLFHRGVRDEAEASRAFGVRVPHHLGGQKNVRARGEAPPDCSSPPSAGTWLLSFSSSASCSCPRSRSPCHPHRCTPNPASTGSPRADARHPPPHGQRGGGGCSGVWGGLTTQSVRVPHCSKWLRRLSSVVSKLRPPMKSLRSCSGSFGDCGEAVTGG